MASLLPFLYLADSPDRGRGIFTAREIPGDSIIELCPVLIIPAAQVPTIHQTVLHDYYFLWGEEGAAAIALGYGSLYNHSATPNADYEMELAENYLRIFARRDIEAGEEITISYTEGGAQRSKLWFEPR